MNGRFSGKKAVVVRVYDDENSKDRKERKFGHALIAGIERHPRRISKSTPAKALEKKSRVKPFVKFVNYNHIMPTRYNIDAGVADKLRQLLPAEGDDKLVPADAGERAEGKSAALLEIKKVLEKRFKELGAPEPKGAAAAGAVSASTGALYFFRKLRF